MAKKKKGHPTTVAGCERKHPKSKKALNACIRAIGGGGGKPSVAHAAKSLDTMVKSGACQQLNANAHAQIEAIKLGVAKSCASPKQLNAMIRAEQHARADAEKMLAAKKKKILESKAMRDLRHADPEREKVLRARLDRWKAASEAKAKATKAATEAAAKARAEQVAPIVDLLKQVMGNQVPRYTPPPNGFGNFNLRTKR